MDMEDAQIRAPGMGGAAATDAGADAAGGDAAMMAPEEPSNGAEGSDCGVHAATADAAEGTDGAEVPAEGAVDRCVRGSSAVRTHARRKCTAASALPLPTGRLHACGMRINLHRLQQVQKPLTSCTCCREAAVQQRATSTAAAAAADVEASTPHAHPDAVGDVSERPADDKVGLQATHIAAFERHGLPSTPCQSVASAADSLPACCPACCVRRSLKSQATVPPSRPPRCQRLQRLRARSTPCWSRRWWAWSCSRQGWAPAQARAPARLPELLWPTLQSPLRLPGCLRRRPRSALPVVASLPPVRPPQPRRQRWPQARGPWRQGPLQRRRANRCQAAAHLREQPGCQHLRPGRRPLPRLQQPLQGPRWRAGAPRHPSPCCPAHPCCRPLDRRPARCLLLQQARQAQGPRPAPACQGLPSQRRQAQLQRRPCLRLWRRLPQPLRPLRQWRPPLLPLLLVPQVPCRSRRPHCSQDGLLGAAQLAAASASGPRLRSRLQACSASQSPSPSRPLLRLARPCKWLPLRPCAPLRLPPALLQVARPAPEPRTRLQPLSPRPHGIRAPPWPRLPLLRQPRPVGPLPLPCRAPPLARRARCVLAAVLQPPQASWT